MKYDAEVALERLKRSGEYNLLSKLQGELEIIWDVGCNIGVWTQVARLFNPRATIHAFEIVPDTYRKFLQNVDIDDNIIPNPFGLYHQHAIVQVKYDAKYSVTASLMQGLKFENEEAVPGIVVPGDYYVDAHNIHYIDFLKLDIEGSEPFALKGLTKAFTDCRIDIVQFEYNSLNNIHKWSLKDAYRFFNERGFTMGRITPTNVEFIPYPGDDYNQANWIALHDRVDYLKERLENETPEAI